MKKTERAWKFCILLVLILCGVFILSLCLGAASIPPGEVWKALFGTAKGSASGNIVLFTRLPRVCAAMLAGAGLAVSGVVIQSVLSNPLASPHILGVNAGAGFAVALLAGFLPLNYKWTSLSAFAGALGAVMIVLLISEKARASKTSLILAGVAMECIFAAATDAILLFRPDALTGYTDFRIGGFSGVAMQKLQVPGIAVPVVIILLLVASNYLDVLMLGTDTAKSLGMPVRKVRILFLAAAAMLAGLAVSFAGVLGFVGLLIPHLMRKLTGGSSRILILTSALGGAVLLSVCDLLARTLFNPNEIPVGIMMSILGGPFFIFLVFRRKKRKYD